ncbi:MAG: hypothetical protein WC794_00025 [Candidatus Doudnabacteria bacterium]|jgi:hypothetical protein
MGNEILDFLSFLTKNHEQKFIEYHYSLLAEKGISNSFYDELSRKFVNYDGDGEKF